MKKKYDIAAYVWPAFTGADKRARIFWDKGIGEWQSVMTAEKRFDGHDWPRKPLWGYVDEADPYVMQMEIEAASDHGVNVFIYDWYWYENRPFLENCLNDGFLKAKNRSKMKFYLMWANHSGSDGWDKNVADGTNQEIWDAKADKKKFTEITNRMIEKYFSQPEYYRIDNKPVLMIYDLQNLVNGLGGINETKEAFEDFRKRVVAAGFDGLHIQFTIWGSGSFYKLTGVDTEKTGDMFEMSRLLGADSITHYQNAHFVDINRNYEDTIPDIVSEWDKIKNNSSIPYYPHVSIGWDNNPRFREFRPNIWKNNTPENFEKLLKEAKKYSDENNTVPLVTINSWNEWTESSYLEPDDIYGYGYLEAVKKVFCE